MDDKQTRDQYHQLIQERNELVQKTKKIGRDVAESSDEDSLTDSENNMEASGDDEMSQSDEQVQDRNRALKDKALKKM